MSRDEVLAIIIGKAREIVPEIEAHLDTTKRMVDLGITSLDFVELTSALMHELKIKASRSELGKVETLDDLTNVFVDALRSK